MEQTPANPVLSVDKNGCVLYSNKAGNTLLNEWGVKIEEKLPSYIRDIVQGVISSNNPEKMEVKVESRTYLVVFSPLPNEEYITITGFDIYDHKKLEEKLKLKNKDLVANLREMNKVSKKLWESESKYRQIIETANEGIWVFNSAAKTIYVNEKMAKMLGYSQKEMCDSSIWDYADEKYKDFFQVRYSNRKQGIDEVYECELCRKNGSPVWFLVSANASFDKDGKFAGSLGMFTDITERKRAEEEIQRTKNMLQLIMNNIPQAIFWKDCNSRYLGCNEVFAEDAGVQFPEYIVGKTDYDLPWIREQTAWYRECDLRVMKNETPEYHIIEQQTTAEGKLTWLDTNKIPLHDEKGNVIGILGTYEDITERKEAEESLKLLNLYNRSLIEASLDPLVTIGSDGKITDVNVATERVTGYSRNDIIGTDFSDYFTEPEKAKKGYQKVFDEGYVIDYELKIKNKNCEVTPVLYNASVYKDESGNVIGVFAAARDITERKKAEEALKKAHDTLEEKVKERTAELEQAYKSLKESEKGLTEAQKMAHIGNWEWDIASDKAYWSDEMYRIFQRIPQLSAPTYNEFLNYVHPDDRSLINADSTKNSNRNLSGNDFRIILDDGEERIIHMLSEVILDERSVPIKIKGIIQDITERKKAEEKIERLANIVEHTNDGIGLITPEGIVLEWNKGEEHIYGYDAEDILGKHISVLVPPHLKNEPMDHVELIKQTRASFNYTTSRLRKDGKTIEVSITLSPVYDNHGKLTAISFITRDITEQKRAEEKLRESEEKYRNIVETANEGILIINNENIITYVNKKMTDMIGYTVEEGLGRPIWGFISEEYRSVVKMHLEERKQGISESYELKLIHKNGSPVWTFLNVKPLFDKEGKYIGAMSMFTDITKRKEAEESLIEFEIARKKEIHHRIKNNLQVISSLLDLQAEKFNGKKNIKDLEVLEAFKETQDRVISMALIHEELHKGGELNTLNFSNYIEKLADNLLRTYRIGNEGINLKTDIEEEVFFDIDTAVPLGIIVNEFLSNSLKYAFPNRENGEIRIKLHREESGECKIEGNKSTNYVLSVSDNGVGIPEDLNIEDFDNSLGLQLVTSLVDQLDGELELERDNGTEFIIRFTVTEKNDQL